MAKRTGDPITLGSGKLYFQEYAGTVPDFTAVKALCTDNNRLALIKGGAALEYSQETYEEKDDLGLAAKAITVKEEVKLKCGLLTWTGNTINILVDHSKVEEDKTKNGVRTTKIGGAGNAKGKYYVLVFHHEDKTDGDLWVVLVGRNTAGLSLTFATESGSVLEAEFTAKPHDTDGTLVAVYEELDKTTTPSGT
jgi:hypothetical protein